MSTAGRHGRDPEPAGDPLVAVNEKLVLTLMDAQEKARTSARLLDEMSRSFGPDLLTRLPNRAVFLDRLVQAMATAKLHHCRLALLSVETAHSASGEVGKGDEAAAIQLLAGRLRGLVGPTDTVSRQGGHGFLVLLPEVLLDETEALAERIQEALSTPFLVSGNPCTRLVGIGAAFYPDHGAAPLELLGSAEAAMHRAMQRGERTMVIFEPSMQPPAGKSPSDAGRAAEEDPPVTGAMAEASPLQGYLCDANEQLLLASVSSLDRQQLAERALQRQTDFLAVLAHELRTPLTPIGLASAMMSEVGPEQIPRLQGIVKRQIVHISRLLSDLLEVSRVNTGKVRLKKEVVSIASVIGQATDTCAASIEERGQMLNTELPRGHARVLGDPVRLAQVFTNLLDNASKYTPEGGAIGIHVQTGPSSVVVTVTDSGIGISPEALPHVFEPFMQDRGAVAFDATGLGIGLTVVRDMIGAHGGQVEAKSGGIGSGSAFVVTLPRVVDPVSRR